MYGPQPNGPSPQHNPGLPQRRRQTQHTSQSPAGQQYNSYQQPAQWRQSEQWNTPAFPTTEATEDPNGFVDISYEYQAAEDPTTYSQVQDPTSPISNDIPQTPGDTQHQACNLNKMEEKVNDLSKVVEHIHQVVTKMAAEHNL
ncbi:hypothetical protein LZ31DRAFT_599790 [Colletotrichum somersetense]|nr:hypothetical protein LZ31DRAFT_599790 [Colletotrichum somersetense]